MKNINDFINITKNDNEKCNILIKIYNYLNIEELSLFLCTSKNILSTQHYLNKYDINCFTVLKLSLLLQYCITNIKPLTISNLLKIYLYKVKVFDATNPCIKLKRENIINIKKYCFNIVLLKIGRSSQGSLSYLSKFISQFNNLISLSIGTIGFTSQTECYDSNLNQILKLIGPQLIQLSVSKYCFYTYI
jgi:hypothetical protein